MINKSVGYRTWATWLHTWRFEWLLLACFLLIELCLDSLGVSPILPDSEGYIAPLRALLGGHGYSIEQNGVYTPSFHRPPGYPLFLAPFLSLPQALGFKMAVWLQRLLLAGALLFCFPPVGKIKGPAAWWMGLGKTVLLLSPPILLNSCFLISDALFLSLTACGLLLLARSLTGRSVGQAALAGVLLGLGTLTRSVGLWLPVFIFCALLAGQCWRRIRPLARSPVALGGVALLVSSIFPLAWCARNAGQGGHWTFSPLTGYNLTLHRQDQILGFGPQTLAGLSAPQRDLIRLIGEGQTVSRARDHVMARYRLNEFVMDREEMAINRRAFQADPLDYFKDTLFHAVNLFLSPMDDFTMLTIIFGDGRLVHTGLGQALRERQWDTVLLHLALRAWHFCFFVLIPGALAWGAWRRGRGDIGARVWWAALFYFVLVTAAAIPTNSRFLLPILPSIGYLYTLPYRKKAEADFRDGSEFAP